MSINLSICIPTYNRAKFINEAIESIISQADNNIEIVIVDGASTDNTEEVVRSFQKYFSQLIYYRAEKRGGIDRDMAKTIELSQGDYCWLLSSDDALKPGAIKRILDEINNGYEIYLCNRTVCNASLKPIKERSWLSRKKIRKNVFNLANKSEILEYLDAANEFGALFSFMSSIIFLRREWNLIKSNDIFKGTCYAHVYILFSIINKGGRLKYIETPLVLNRSFNDSFLEKGIVDRFLVDIEGYLLLAEKLFGDDEFIKKEFLKVMTLEHPWYHILKVRSYIDKCEQWKQIEKRLLKCGYSHNILEKCYKLGKYRDIVSFAVSLKRIYSTSIIHHYTYLFFSFFRHFLKQ